jgi:hypothetical protein
MPERLDATSADRTPEPLRGFGPTGILAALFIVALPGLLGIPVLLWAHFSRTPWRDLGFVRPRSWARTVAMGAAAGVVLKLLLKAIIMPLLGAEAVNPAYHFLVGNSAALPWMIVTIVVRAGFGEEIVFRGFLFERLGRLLGRGRGATVAIVLLTSALFAIEHYPDQGLAGAEQAMITGLVLGTTFAITGRIWTVMIVHIAYDLAAAAIIYADLESYVAHLVFR